MVRHFLWEKDQVGSIPAYLKLGAPLYREGKVYDKTGRVN